MKILDFPSVRQSTVDTCSCACVQSCLFYYGIDKREGQIRSLMKVERNPLEVHPKKIVKALRKFGLQATYTKLDLSDVIESICVGDPVILNLQAWFRSKRPDYASDNNGHYAVAIGYDERRIIFSDPACYYKSFLFFNELEKRWHDGNATDWDYDHMGILVCGGKPQYNRDKMVRMK